MYDLEARYGFAKQVAALTDHQLIARFNQQVGNQGWGNARSYFLHCLRQEIESRTFDSSVIFHESGMRLSKKVALVGDKVVLAEDSQP